MMTEEQLSSATQAYTELHLYFNAMTNHTAITGAISLALGDINRDMGLVAFQSFLVGYSLGINQKK